MNLRRNWFAKPVSNRFRIFQFCTISLSNLKPVWRIRANRFGDSLVERTKMADGEAVFLYSKRRPFRKLRFNAVVALAMTVA